MHSLQRSMELGNYQFELEQVKARIISEEGSLLAHRAAVRECRKELKKETKRCRDEGMDDAEMEEDFDFAEALKEYDQAKRQVEKIDERVKSHEDELAACQKAYDDAKRRHEELEGDGTPAPHPIPFAPTPAPRHPPPSLTALQALTFLPCDRRLQCC